ncbi:hypothetical protein [Mycoplasmopsis agassizii]|uniref:Uncharacterized protein n=1 Tax=Mycoplasmopsis agassizii TaxID=33922 RepID=A0ABX4H688_9BACT|nr:hypothetical protein [Mycoplasmopsis agassizii]PAF55410.1 hypothetical protein CJF60_01830 [Mycoplasmopsis agassizii]SMC18317.1 hypothetical protein SAMN02745179_00649 [Mycoplasmopsis agassizii]
MNKIKKIIMPISALTILSASLAIACTNQSNPSDPINDTRDLKTKATETLNDWTGKLSVAYETNWKPALDLAISKLPESMQSRIQLIPIDTGQSVNYIQNTVYNSAQTSADVFASPLDRFQGLVDRNIVTVIPENYLSDYKQQRDNVKIQDKYYAYPLNTESVIAFYNKDAYANGISDIKDEMANPVEKKFAFQAANLWHGSTLFNGLFKTINDNDATKATNFWASWDAQNKVSAPFIANEKVQARVKEIYDYYNKLRKGDNEKYKQIANSKDQREKVIIESLADSSVSLTIEGPPILPRLVGFVLKQNDSNPAKAVEILNKISAQKLPKYNGEQMLHFKAGWGYALNRVSLANATGSDKTKAADGKLAFANYFTQILTSKEISSAWITNAGKISAADDATREVDVKLLTIEDPQDPRKKIDLTKFIAQSGFENAIKNLYSGVVNAVLDQTKENINQPKWPTAEGYWKAWDDHGLIKSDYASSNAFLEAFKANVNTQVNEANKPK